MGVKAIMQSVTICKECPVDSNLKRAMQVYPIHKNLIDKIDLNMLSNFTISGNNVKIRQGLTDKKKNKPEKACMTE